MFTISPKKCSPSLGPGATSTRSPKSIPTSESRTPTASQPPSALREARGERSDRPQDRLHQPHHLGRIRRLCADLGLCLRPHRPGPHRRGARGFPERPRRAPHRARDRVRPRRPAPPAWTSRRSSIASSGSPTASRSCSRSSRTGRFRPPTRSPPAASTAGSSSGRVIGGSGGTSGRASSLASKSIFSATGARRSRRRCQRPRRAALRVAPSRRDAGADSVSPQLTAGEIVTTGTLTRAFPVAAGEKWTTQTHGRSAGARSNSSRLIRGFLVGVAEPQSIIDFKSIHFIPARKGVLTSFVPIFGRHRCDLDLCCTKTAIFGCR